MKSENDRPVALEDLLRLKRAERPPAEFWSEFDRQLRAKQLAALVVKRPWWHDVPRLWSGLPRYALPVGAAAAVAVGFLSLRHYSSSHSVPVAPAMAASVEVDVPRVTDEIVPPAVVATLAAATEVPAAVLTAQLEMPVATATAAASEPMLVSEATAPGELAQLVSLVGVSSGAAEMSAPLTATYSPASLTATTIASGASGASNLLGSRSVLEERPARARTVIEPLQQMAPPGERRSTRLLTAMVSKAALVEGQGRNIEKKSRLDEERLYDQVSRFGARGDRLEVKF